MRKKYPWVTPGVVQLNGYVEVRTTSHPIVGDCRIYEHRLVMAEYLGRKLERTEHVHHIDHNRLNNRIENLQLVSKAEHLDIHSIKGQKRDPAIGRKISAAKKGKPQPWASANGKAIKGRVRSEEFKRKVSEGMKRYRASLEA